MDERTRTLFYTGGIFLNLDSDEIDQILADAGLSAERDTLDACREAVRQYIGPAEFERRMIAGRAMFGDGRLTRVDAEHRGMELVTIAEAAKIRGVSVQAISQALDAGRLTAYYDESAHQRQARRLVDRAEL